MDVKVTFSQVRDHSDDGQEVWPVVWGLCDLLVHLV